VDPARARAETNLSIKSAILAVVAFAGSVVGALAVEEAPHQVLSRDGDFEIREYPHLAVAETTVQADRSSAAYTGFRLLAGYIFGGNASRQEIAMTAPVIEAPAPNVPAGAGWVIRFMMPSGSSLTNLPRPNADGVTLREEPAARFAVLRFSGLATDAAVTARTADLSGWMKNRNLAPSGTPLIAQYDPPWTLRSCAETRS
jgi:hypothetical protein